MFALVLVGGFGTRLRPLTEHTPKQMLPICGVPMIEWVVSHLADHGIQEIGLALGYRPDAFIAAYPDGRIAGLPYKVAVEPEARGTAGAIRFAAQEMQLEETFLVLNGDVLTDLDVGALVDFHGQRNAEATIALQAVADPSRFGVVTTDNDGQVREFIEKPPMDASPSNNINAGTYVVNPSVIDRIPDARPVSIEREIFPEMALAETLYAMKSDTYWLDTGTPEQFLEANLDALRGRRKNKPTLPVAAVDATAQVEDSVIGTGTHIGAEATVKRSVLFAGCQVSKGVTIIDSVLSDDVHVGEGARIERSVIGLGERISAGTQLVEQTRPEP
ncbi:MAG TPA: mannose-1-phosphate guanylyltransferase [Acidimicrobiaceae bacterium]|nr:mannose-1-phosphate guanylyltransferase [Acidimicrobiaceae bacterium]